MLYLSNMDKNNSRLIRSVDNFYKFVDKFVKSVDNF